MAVGGRALESELWILGSARVWLRPRVPLPSRCRQGIPTARVKVSRGLLPRRLAPATPGWYRHGLGLRRGLPFLELLEQQEAGVHRVVVLEQQHMVLMPQRLVITL